MQYLHLLIISLKLKYNMRVLNKITKIKKEATDILNYVEIIEKGLTNGKKQ